jgi:DNA-binding CsgD family transcriptional regulator
MLSRAHFSLGDFPRASSALESAVALAEHELPHDVVEPLCRHADAVMMTAGPASALPLAARARELARGGTTRLQDQASAKWGSLAYLCGDPTGLTTVESAGTRLLRSGRKEVAADIRAGGSGVLVPFAVAAAQAEHPDAEAAFRIGIDEADRVGAVTSAAALRIPYGLMLLRVRLRDCFPVADRLLAIADLVPLAEPFARTLKAYAFLEMGEEQQHATETDRARATATSFGTWLALLWLDHGQGLHYLRHGRFEEASDLYADIEARYRALGIGEPCVIPFARHAVVAHARAARAADAERVITWLDECAGRLPCQWPAAAAAAGRALLAFRSGDLAGADAAYRAAIAHLDRTSLPLAQAEVLIEHGTLLRRDGRPREARESLRRAGELAESVGGVWLARRASEELAAAGGRRRTRRGADELTPQEQAIARLAATGASDKDIATHLTVSVRTVRTHLEHIYAKLGIHSRRELMAMGERLEALIGHKR